MAHSAQKGKLLAIIGDEVSQISKIHMHKYRYRRPFTGNFILFHSLLPFPKDTVTGFLLGGIGEVNKTRTPNFLVVNKGNISFHLLVPDHPSSLQYDCQF